MLKLPDELSVRFDPKDVKILHKGGKEIPYVSIDATIRRLNDTLGAQWSTNLRHSKVTPIFDPEGNLTTYLAEVAIELYVDFPKDENHEWGHTKYAVGVGADVAKDPDKAVKTALAEAIKKAGHQLGIGLYLWIEEERDTLEELRKMPLSELQKDVVELYKASTGKTDKPTATELKKFFGMVDLGRESCAAVIYRERNKE